MTDLDFDLLAGARDATSFEASNQSRHRTARKKVTKPTMTLCEPTDPIQREAAGWALALIAATPIKSSRACELDELTGLGAEVCGLVFDSTSDTLFDRDLRAFLCNVEGRPWEHWRQDGCPTLTRNIAHVCEWLGLSEADACILRMAALKSRSDALSVVLSAWCLSNQRMALCAALRRLSGCDEVTWAAATAEHSARNRLVQFELVSGLNTLDPLDLDDALKAVLFDPEGDVESVLRGFMRESPAPTLDRSHFPHLERDTRILLPWLREAIDSQRVGCNVLIYGEPGVGKTEYARWLAQALDALMLEVPIEARDGDPLDGETRLGRFGLCQQIAMKRQPALVLFDEVEDAFTPALFQRRKHSKAWTNEQMEQNPVPTLWLCNWTGGINPAHLRRYDLIIQMRTPPRSQRLRIAREAFADTPLPERSYEALAAHAELTPAHVARMAGVIEALPVQQSEQRAEVLRHLAMGRLEVTGVAWRPEPDAVPSHYRPDLVHADVDLEALVVKIRRQPQARLCLDGPPGTGKSVFAKYLAQQLDRPVLLRRASDLMSKWVGETERNLAQAFREAEAEAAVLVVDEADSFLAERGGAAHGWEVSQVNELLAQLENFEGVFVATTNRMDALDRAALRRFDHKIRFGWLKPEQRIALFSDVLRDLGADRANVSAAARVALDRLDRLTPGDFAVIRRQHAADETPPTSDVLLEGLRREMAFKRDRETRPIGFLQ